jgi:hypothetical protein
MGPTVHIRLLILLAERNLLADPSKISQLLSSTQTTLPQLKQVCTPSNIRKVLSLSGKSLVVRCELGHRRFRNVNDWEHACFAYNTAAELAAALVRFNKATKRLYRIGCGEGPTALSQQRWLSDRIFTTVHCVMQLLLFSSQSLYPQTIALTASTPQSGIRTVGGLHEPWRAFLNNPES